MSKLHKLKELSKQKVELIRKRFVSPTKPITTSHLLPQEHQ